MIMVLMKFTGAQISGPLTHTYGEIKARSSNTGRTFWKQFFGSEKLSKG